MTHDAMGERLPYRRGFEAEIEIGESLHHLIWQTLIALPLEYAFGQENAFPKLSECSDEPLLLG